MVTVAPATETIKPTFAQVFSNPARLDAWQPRAPKIIPITPQISGTDSTIAIPKQGQKKLSEKEIKPSTNEAMPKPLPGFCERVDCVCVCAVSSVG